MNHIRQGVTILTNNYICAKNVPASNRHTLLARKSENVLIAPSILITLDFYWNSLLIYKYYLLSNPTLHIQLSYNYKIFLKFKRLRFYFWQSCLHVIVYLTWIGINSKQFLQLDGDPSCYMFPHNIVNDSTKFGQIWTVNSHEIYISQNHHGIYLYRNTSQYKAPPKKWGCPI